MRATSIVIAWNVVVGYITASLPIRTIPPTRTHTAAASINLHSRPTTPSSWNRISVLAHLSSSSSSSSRSSNSSNTSMPRGVQKEHLPRKVCVVCHRPFTWRKKWENCWEEVTTCSKSCKRQRRATQQRHNQQQRAVLAPLTGGEDEPQRQQAAQASSSASTPVAPSYDKITSTSLLLQQLEEAADRALSPPLPPSIEHFDDGNDDASLSSSSSLLSDDDDPAPEEEIRMDPRAARKAAKKRAKAERRARRHDPTCGQKPCDICGRSVDLLVRCQVDASNAWKMVCGRCWHDVSGGVVDGDAQHPHYRYGGLWKNRRRRAK